MPLGSCVDSVLDIIGNTPCVRLSKLSADVPGNVYVKLEMQNPSGGLKDRILLHIVEKAEREGTLRPGMTLIEATTGSTGIATSLIGAVKGYRVMIVMPEGMSVERRRAIQTYGAEVHLTAGGGSDIDAAINRVKEIVEENPDKYFHINQFANPENVAAHYEGTGPEIWNQMDGCIDAFVMAYGTGATLTGVGRYLKERNADIHILGVEPAESPVLARGQKGSHRIEGVGDGIVPPILDTQVMDDLALVTSEDAYATSRLMAREEGIFSGPSSGANVFAALELSKRRPELTNILTVLGDTGWRYLSVDGGLVPQGTFTCTP